MQKIYLWVTLLPLLVACSNLHQQTTKESQPFLQESHIFDIVMEQYAHNIENSWGPKEIIIPTPKEFLEYSADFKTRSFINFNKNKITFETIDGTHYRSALKKAIISLLLLPDYHAEAQQTPDTPFLLGQVWNNKSHKVIKTRTEIQDFADYLIKHAIKYRYSSIHRKIYTVSVSLVFDHVDERAKKYIPYINMAAKKYNINKTLILAIIETESEFNPYAVSPSAAIGLMQVQAHTAGKDVFKRRGLKGEPSRGYLLDPRKNIDLGTAYLALVKNDYLKGIKNPQSMRYALITAYNGGAGSVLRTFSKNRERAIQIINNMTPQQVYQTLATKHPSAETRRYLFKVLRAQNQLLSPKLHNASMLTHS